MNYQRLLAELKLPFLSHNIEQLLSRMQADPQAALSWWLNSELAERSDKKLASRLKAARLGRFKTMQEFDWDWPTKLERAHLKYIFSDEFFKDMKNVLVVGPEGLGKTMIAKNLAYSAIQHGFRSLFVTASALVADLNVQKDSRLRELAIRRYTNPQLLVIDEIGYVTYSQDSAFNLFEVVSRRYEKSATIVTTNIAFKDWSQIFPDAHCVTSLVDRLFHHSIVLQIGGPSYRLHEHRKSQEQGRKEAMKKKDSLSQEGEPNAEKT